VSHSNYSGPHQVHKKRPDGYWHGAVIFGDSAQARNDLDSAGWFPGVHLTKASSSLVAKFQQSIGGAAGADALEVPKEWAKQDDEIHAAMCYVALDSAEAQPLIAKFMSTLSAAPPKIISLHRVQNKAMWQSYAVKKITMMSRADACDSWERPILFHGTDTATAVKIIQQGFNRNFAGLNATFFGKGVCEDPTSRTS